MLKTPLENVVVQPVVGLRDAAPPLREASADPTVRWEPVGPVSQAQVKMTGYRWSLSYADVVLTWRDFFSET